MFEIVGDITNVQVIATGSRHSPSEDAAETTRREAVAQTQGRCYRSVSERIDSPSGSPLVRGSRRGQTRTED
jgi:hypothetical protein